MNRIVRCFVKIHSSGLLVQKNGVTHKFGIHVKHKTHYLAVQLHNYVNENIYAFTSCACLVGLRISRNWDCWVSSLSTPFGLLTETTQLMFHTLKGKGKKLICFARGVVCKLGCVEIFIAHVWFPASNLQPHKALFPWLPQPEKGAEPGCTGFLGPKPQKQPKKEARMNWELGLCADVVFWHWHCSKHSMMLRRNARKALELQIANISPRISVSPEKQRFWSIGFSGYQSFSACEQYNQKEDDILVPVSVDNHEESTNIIFIFFIFNHEHNTTENCLLDMCCMWCTPK